MIAPVGSEGAPGREPIRQGVVRIFSWSTFTLGFLPLRFFGRFIGPSSGKQTFDLNVRFSADCVRFSPKSGRIDTVWPYDVIPLYRAPRSVWTRHGFRIKVIAGPPIVVAHSRAWGTEEDRSYAV